MWLKQLIIDGFKSYADRTVIDGWDPSFTAITGLNGSGKSNILDAICFVLGISNLSQVRAANLQELVYKQGQTRVTKASVTVVFDNRDPKMSPVGYEHCEEITVTRQVVIGGRNKYLINGHTAQLSRVQNLFHSQQLNVNNPHFLIMQGRITKVCNMKPMEILSLIEEAAGTSMYETKKKSAQKTIAHKQVKVAEINKILEEEITPQLEKLRKEQSSYMQWSSNNTEIERLERLCVALRFHQASQIANESKSDVKALEDTATSLQEQEKELQSEMKEHESAVAELTAQKEREMESAFKRLDARVTAESKQLVKDTSVWQHTKDNLAAEEKSRKELQKSAKDLQTVMSKKQKQVDDHKAAIAQSQDEYAKLTDRISTLESQQLGVGMSDDKKEKGSLASQLMEAQRAFTEAGSEVQSVDIKLKHVSTAAKQKDKAAEKEMKEFTALKKKCEQKEAEATKLQAQLKKMHFEPAAVAECEAKISSLNETIAQLKDAVMSASSGIGSMEFEYTAPSANFDRSKVKGVVAKLLTLKDPKAAMALEQAAGGKLFNVIIDTEITGKALLEKGQLRKRATFLPLNKIQGKSIPRDVVARAQELAGKENAVPAIELVEYAPELQAAMTFVFGNTFVCKDAATAKIVAYDRDIRTRAVTLEGDVFEPAGTLTGGSAANGGSVLVKVEKLKKAQSQLQHAQAELATLQAKLQQLKEIEQNSREITVQAELCSHEVTLLQTRMEQCAYAQANKEVEELKQQIADLSAKKTAAEQTRDSAQERCAELERQIKDFESERKDKMKEIEKDLAACKKKLSASTQLVKKQQQEQEKLQLECDGLAEELQGIQEQITKCDQTIATLEAEVAKLAEVVAQRKTDFDTAQAALDAEKARLAETDKEIHALEKRRNQVSKALSEVVLELKKIQNKIARVQADEKDAKKRVEAMLKQYDWIAQERKLFGAKNSDYDFSTHDAKQADAKLAKLQREQESLSKRINKKVMGMFEKAEQEYKDLVRKRDIIEKDKTKIEQVITELDRKKNEALEATWQKVTKDFGSVFGSLLPGAMAKLEPTAGKSVLDGLEMKVSFNGAWKESLSELSGGQRSLLALSLILSLLLFKPAPMYILDEIDAALDLSHTQNIGTMLKTHFPQSQFIVVSLKEGMFNNANVVFRTKFVDGVSTVSRTQLRTNAKAK